ncbi:MAG TPA: hypothetical protein VGI98_06895 [Candidatus Limnocylindrales bacterium]|jgi:hypothetical protein
MAGAIVRACLVGLGLLIMLGGIWSITQPEIGAAGLTYVVIGGALVVAVALERQRYRSTTAELTNAPAGPGGGETPGAAVDSRFQPTAEVFVDPTSGRRMRVLVDPATGERRYVAEA